MLVLELLCFCVGRHAYRIKYYVLRNTVVEAALKLLRRREPWLGVAVVRFVRTCVGLKVGDVYYKGDAYAAATVSILSMLGVAVVRFVRTCVGLKVGGIGLGDAYAAATESMLSMPGVAIVCFERTCVGLKLG